MTRLSLIVAEESFLIRKGLLSVINSIIDLSEICEIDNRQELLNHRNRLNPDILIINPDLLLKENYLDLSELRSVYKETKIAALVLGQIDVRMIDQFDEVINIKDPKDIIIKKIQELQIAKSSDITSSNESSELSQRETEVLKCLTSGLTSKEIADKLFISTHTVITHRKNITGKLGIKSISGLTVYAILNNLINMEDVQ